MKFLYGMTSIIFASFGLLTAGQAQATQIDFAYGVTGRTGTVDLTVNLVAPGENQAVSGTDTVVNLPPAAGVYNLVAAGSTTPSGTPGSFSAYDDLIFTSGLTVDDHGLLFQNSSGQQVLFAAYPPGTSNPVPYVQSVAGSMITWGERIGPLAVTESTSPGSAVPEPAGLLVLAVGLLGLGLARRGKGMIAVS